MDGLLARLPERRPSNSDDYRSPKHYIEEIGVTNFVRAASADPAAAAVYAHVFEETEPMVEERVEL